MRRRDLIVGLGAAGVLGAGAVTALSSIDQDGTFGGITGGDGDGDRIEPLDLPRIEATGSPPGTETIPDPGRVTYLALFATWCGICQRKMDQLGAAYTSLESEPVQFVSVTNEPIGTTIEPQDVRDWWDDFDGFWPVAHDADLDLTMAVDAPGVPYSVVFDADNRITWSDGGYKTADDILAHIEDAR